jgi:hypothetical protein
MESNEAPSIPQEPPIRTSCRVGTIFAVVVGLGLAGAVLWWMLTCK